MCNLVTNVWQALDLGAVLMVGTEVVGAEARGHAFLCDRGGKSCTGAGRLRYLWTCSACPRLMHALRHRPTRTSHPSARYPCVLRTICMCVQTSTDTHNQGTRRPWYYNVIWAAERTSSTLGHDSYTRQRRTSHMVQHITEVKRHSTTLYTVTCIEKILVVFGIQ